MSGSGSGSEYNYVGTNFVIEKNIHKGMKKDFDLKSENIGDMILKHLRTHSSAIGQIDAETGKQTSFSEMRENMTRCALWLEKHCVNKGDVVAVCTHNNLDSYIPVFATFLVGAVFNPWHHEITLKMARHSMSLTRPKVIFVCESAVKVLRQAAKLENLDPHFVVFGKDPELDSLRDVLRLQTLNEVDKFKAVQITNLRSIAIILFSSGTTGLPKGVALSYEVLLRSCVGSSLLPNMKGRISLWYSSLYWISGTFLTIQTLMYASTRIIHTNPDPEETCKVIEKYKVNSYLLTPSTMTYFCKSDCLSRYKLKSLETLLTGGAKNSKDILEDFKRRAPHVQLIQAYGMTELGGVASIQNKECKGIDSVGFVSTNVEMKVVDLDSGKALGPNQPGEIYVRTPMIMLEYYKNPAATKATVNAEGWVLTGDKGYYTEEGEWFIIDRLKEVMKFRGHQVSPYELEEVILNHPGVLEAAVVPLPHALDLERPMAFVKRRPGVTVTEEEIIKLSAELGEMKKLWGGVKFVDEMPYTASGKINRKDLKEMAKSMSTCKI